jgi:predicted ester cyclase
MALRLVAFVEMYRTAYPDTRLAIGELIAEGDLVAMTWTATGTHQGELMGIAPTGRSVTVTGIGVDRISGGQIAESWANYDALGMLLQLGAIPAPATA